MENYKIITDESALRDFIDWLPDLEDNEQFYLSLFARRKYNKNLIKSNDKTQLKRFTSTKERMFNKISQLEIPKGRWFLKDVEAPQDSLVLYILPNPRDMKKATAMMGRKCWDLYRSMNFNLAAEAMSCIQQSKSRAVYVDFDIDDKNIDLDKPWLDANIGSDNYDILETFGGYHIIVKPKSTRDFRIKEDLPLNWHQLIREKYPVDQSGDQMISLPGCVHSTFTPKFI